MGVAAVPGSGKTWTLSLLAAKLIAEGDLGDDQEVLIVTLVNSAVDNFAGRVAGFVKARGLLPGVGYRVRTLHGLAHDIVRERPGLVGLSDEFNIVDERVSDEIMRDAALAWLRSHPGLDDAYLSADLDESALARVRANQWPDLIVGVAQAVIKQAKDLQITPAGLRYSLAEFPERVPLLEMGCTVYADYQRALAYRGAVDFDDLIRLALQTLRLDPAFLARLRHRWPYILEDEAQDSSRLQEVILKELVGPEGNWVRVGDPNQAIYETFTTANPRYLREFLDSVDVVKLALPNSGRSMQSVIDLANALIAWTAEEHPVPELQDALGKPFIKPAPPGDPQPNPPDDPQEIRFASRGLAPQAEIDALVRSSGAWVREHPEQTIAILVPRNTRGFEIADALKKAGVPNVELLRSTPTTRQAAGALANVVRHLADPASSRKLAVVYRVWRRDERDDDIKADEIKAVAKLIAQCPHVEDYIWPRSGYDWLETVGGDAALPLEIEAHLEVFRTMVRRWHEATALPADQLILTLGQDLFSEPADLAITHKLALSLRQMADRHPNWRLPELAEELATVARNERRFIGFTEADTGLDPEQYRGQVVVTTMHKAKGLEWDKVYLVSVNDYDFPSALPQDRFISEPWYVRDQLNLQAEALAQLEALDADPDLFDYDEGAPTLVARRDYAAERLRLLFVGITRARRALTVTWNTGRHGTAQPAVPLIALQTWWEEQNR